MLKIEKVIPRFHYYLNNSWPGAFYKVARYLDSERDIFIRLLAAVNTRPPKIGICKFACWSPCDKVVYYDSDLNDSDYWYFRFKAISGINKIAQVQIPPGWHNWEAPLMPVKLPNLIIGACRPIEKQAMSYLNINPLAAMIAGGLAGGGLGYLGGSVYDFIYGNPETEDPLEPEEDRNKRRNLRNAAIGAALGTIPGLLWWRAAAKTNADSSIVEDLLVGNPGSGDLPLDKVIDKEASANKDMSLMWKSAAYKYVVNPINSLNNHNSIHPEILCSKLWREKNLPAVYCGVLDSLVKAAALFEDDPDNISVGTLAETAILSGFDINASYDAGILLSKYAASQIDDRDWCSTLYHLVNDLFSAS